MVEVSRIAESEQRFDSESNTDLVIGLVIRLFSKGKVM